MTEIIYEGPTAQVVTASDEQVIVEDTTPAHYQDKGDDPTIFVGGPQGPPGVDAVNNVFVQNVDPRLAVAAPPLPKEWLWVQTNMGASGEDFTLWIEDGDA